MPNPTPSPPPEDRAFERYRTADDGAALAEVFDRTAPALLAFARGTIADRHLAEDLVQQAFVVAIESRADWDAERSLLPWLMGILAHRARNLSRREQHRAHEALDPALDAAAPGADAGIDPLEAASLREFDRAVRDGIDALPEPYGPVVDMHLRHGLTAAEIARALRRPAGTVRTQIVRGSRMLRAALPQGFAVAGAAVALDRAALASVRAAVLEHAGVSGASVGAVALAPKPLGLFGVLSSTLLMNKLLLSLTALLVIVLSVGAAFGLWSDGSVPPSATPAASVGDPVPARDDPGSDPTARMDRAGVARREDAGPGAGAPASPLAVRVLQAWDDAPARLVRVAATLGDGRVVESVTEADGVARWEEDLPGDARVELPDFESKAVTSTAGAQSSIDFRVPPRIDVAVRVVDEHGAPVPGAQLFAFHGLGPDLTRDDLGRTGPDGVGRLRSASAIVPLRAAAPGYLPGGPRLLTAKRPPREPVEIALGGPAREVRIDVSDVEGRAVQNACVHVFLTGQPRVHPLVARTSAHGEAFVEIPAGEPFLVLAAAGVGPTSGFAAREGSPADAVSPVSVRLDPPARVTGVARDANGAPVAGAEVRGVWSDPRIPNAFARGWQARATTAEDGSFAIEGLFPGPTALRLEAAGVEVEVARELSAGRTETWNPEVPRAATWTLRLANPAGEPLAGWLAELEADDPEWNGAGAVTDAQGAAAFAGLGAGAAIPEVRVEARAPLRGIGVSGAFDGATAFAWDGVATASDQKLVVPVEHLPTASLTGAVADGNGGPAAGVEIVLLRRVAGTPVVIRLVSDANGRFAYGPTAPGTLSLAVRDDRGSVLRPDVRLAVGEELQLGTLYLGKPADLAVRLSLPLEAPSLALRLGAGTESVPLDLRDDGHWHTPASLPPGDYVVEVRERGAVVREHLFFLAPGRTTTLDLR